MKNTKNTAAFTLLEVLLAMAVAVLILGAIAMAIDLHLRTLDTRRGDVDEAQIARAVLKNLANDLRGTVRYEEFDLSGVEEAAGSASITADAAGDDLDAGALADDADASIEQSLEPPLVPGLYGNQYELQLDVSRLPRVDEYEAIFLAAGGAQVVTIPSDIKTVSWYIRNELTMSTDPMGAAGGFGLVRRELDREVTSWAVANGETDSLSAAGTLIAPEIEYIEFQYFSGLQWTTEWDTDSYGGLPMAVRITLGIRRNRDSSASATRTTPATSPTPIAITGIPENMLLHTLTVRLPMARPIDLDSIELDETSTEASP